MLHSLYTAGYARWQPAQLLSTVNDLGALLLDIRMTPWSKRIDWQQPQMRATFGATYRHERALGNKNYNNDGVIELADPVHALVRVEKLLAQQPVILLCGCADVNSCHRMAAAEYIEDRLDCTVVHLEAPTHKAAHRTAPAVPRHELPCLQHLDSEVRFYLTMYLRGAQDSDQETARARCAELRIDYGTAHDEVQRN